MRRKRQTVVVSSLRLVSPAHTLLASTQPTGNRFSTQLTHLWAATTDKPSPRSWPTKVSFRNQEPQLPFCCAVLGLACAVNIAYLFHRAEATAACQVAGVIFDTAKPQADARIAAQRSQGLRGDNKRCSGADPTRRGPSTEATFCCIENSSPLWRTYARFARMFSGDLEGHAPSWPCIKHQRTRPQRVPPSTPFGCGHRPLWGFITCKLRINAFAKNLRLDENNPIDKTVERNVFLGLLPDAEAIAAA